MLSVDCNPRARMYVCGFVNSSLTETWMEYANSTAMHLPNFWMTQVLFILLWLLTFWLCWHRAAAAPLFPRNDFFPSTLTSIYYILCEAIFPSFIIAILIYFGKAKRELAMVLLKYNVIVLWDGVNLCLSGFLDPPLPGCGWSLTCFTLGLQGLSYSECSLLFGGQQVQF